MLASLFFSQGNLIHQSFLNAHNFKIIYCKFRHKGQAKKGLINDTADTSSAD